MNYKGRRRRPKCFTLIELIVVLVILGILAALAIPTFNAVRQRGTETVANADATTIARHATDLYAFYQGTGGNTDQGVYCSADPCTVAEIVQSSAGESGYDDNATAGGPYSFPMNSGDAVLSQGTGDTWELNKAADTENATCALITYDAQAFTVSDCPTP